MSRLLISYLVNPTGIPFSVVCPQNMCSFSEKRHLQVVGVGIDGFGINNISESGTVLTAAKVRPPMIGTNKTRKKNNLEFIYHLVFVLYDRWWSKARVTDLSYFPWGEISYPRLIFLSFVSPQAFFYDGFIFQVKPGGITQQRILEHGRMVH